MITTITILLLCGLFKKSQLTEPLNFVEVPNSVQKVKEIF